MALRLHHLDCGAATLRLHEVSVAIEIDLPEQLVGQARVLGLLERGPMAELLASEVKRRTAGRNTAELLSRVRGASGEALSMAEINAEVKAARGERRAREAGS